MPLDGFEQLDRLTRDLKDASRLLDRKEVRYFVDCYYQIQDFRIAAAGQIRSSDEEEPNRMLKWFFDSMRKLEAGAKNALGEFASSYKVGQWLQSICGIGPVISAGLMAHLDIRVAKYAGAFWKFAGLDPSSEWNKGQKRPWNARLKVLCWKAGESFVKVQNNDKDFYGKIFAQRKAFEEICNERGENKEAAAKKLEKFKIGKDTDAYKAYSIGKFPKAHIHARARRYAVKLFLSHVHEVMYRDYFGCDAPVPYVFGIEQHGLREASKINPPNWSGEFDGKSLKEMFAE